MTWEQERSGVPRLFHFEADIQPICEGLQTVQSRLSRFPAIASCVLPKPGAFGSRPARRSPRYTTVTDVKSTARRAALVMGILGVAAAATAMWNQYAPTGVCLYCVTPEHYEMARNATPPAAATAGVGVRRGTGLGASSKSNILPDMSVAPSSHESSGSTPVDAPRDWAPWEHSSETHGLAVQPAGSLWIGMGELRRMVSVGHYAEPGGGMATAAPRSSHEQGSTAEARSSSDGPPAVEPGTPVSGGNSGPNPSSPNQGPGSPTNPPATSTNPGMTLSPGSPGVPPVATTPPSGGGTPAVGPPTNPFVEHTTPPADPFVPRPPVGLLDPGNPGNPGGTVTTPGRGPAATPEPASVLLIGTGLAAILSQLRRRGVI
jgi:PEP-CTERM motif-containing protein